MTRLLLSACALALLGGCAFQAGGLFQPLNPVVASLGQREPEVPYVQTPMPVVDAMLDMAEVGSGDYLIDLGSGDGRIVIAAVRRGAQGLGVDIDPARVAEAVNAARFAGVEGRAVFRRHDLFATPIREASVIAIYLLPDVNLRLRPRLLTELRPGTRIVSHAFAMGDWRPDAHRDVDGRNAYLWIVPAVAGGQWLLTGTDGSRMLLELEQRFQEVRGTLTVEGRSLALSDATLRGDKLRFMADGRAYAAIIDDAAMRPDPDAPGERGWQGRRID
jgi:SAM-dependent methyltransferase